MCLGIHSLWFTKDVFISPDCYCAVIDCITRSHILFPFPLCTPRLNIIRNKEFFIVKKKLSWNMTYKEWGNTKKKDNLQLAVTMSRVELNSSSRDGNFVTFNDTRLENDLATFLPHLSLQSLSREDMLGETCLDVLKVCRVVVSKGLQDMLGRDTKGAETVQNRYIETTLWTNWLAFM